MVVTCQLDQFVTQKLLLVGPALDMRMPVATAFEKLKAGSDIDEIIEQFQVTREQVKAVLEFAARSLSGPEALEI